MRAVIEDDGGGREYNSGRVESIMGEGKRSGFDDTALILGNNKT